MNLKRNFIYNLLYQILIIFLPIVTIPYVSRVLGPQGVGKFSYTLSYSQYFILFGMLGISLYGSRQIAYIKNDKEILSREFSNIYLLQFLCTSIALIIYLILFVIINNQDSRILYLIQGITVLASVFDISWFFIGYEDMKSVVLRNTLFKIVGIICILLFVKEKNDLFIYAIILSISNFLGQLVMWLNLKGKINFYKPKFSEMKKHFSPTIGLFISQLAIQIYTLLDKTMLGLITTAEQVGLYDNSQKTLKLALTIITSLGVVMMPRMSSLYSEGKIEELKRLIYKAFKFVNIMVFPMVLGLIVISNSFSLWFYGQEFNGIGLLLRTGSLILIFIGWSNILGIQVMLPMKKEKEFTKSVVIGAIINFILNLILINNLYSLGTTISSVIAEISVTVSQIYFLRDFINLKEILKTIIKPALSSVIMFFILVEIMPIFEIGIIYTFIEVIIGASVYFIALYLMKEELLLEAINLMKFKILKKGGYCI